MCGIVGQLQFDTTPVDQSRLKEAADTLEQRGPDDSGFHLENGIGFGHRRLSIQDLSQAGHQPMSSADGRYVIVYNGEIYNFLELRNQLERQAWVSGSDTEVLLAAYTKWGVGCLEKLQGMFAFAIWDRLEQRLFAARDRMGVKPFYYHHRQERFLFSSRPAALHLLAPELTNDLDEQALRFYLEAGYIPAPHSINRGIRKLPPAHYLLVDKDGLKIERYWDFRQIAPENSWEERKEEELLDELDEMVEKSVRARMISDAPLGAFLSGGIDSSLAVAVMQKLSPNQIKTFTIGFDESRYDESRHAAAVAAYLKTDHHCEQLRVDDLLDLLPAFSGTFDEPFFDSSAFPVMAVSRLASRHVSVSLSGDGADELFGGYHYYQIAKKVSPLFRLPNLLRRTLSLGVGMIPKHNFQLLAGAINQRDAAASFAFTRGILKDYNSVLLPEVMGQTKGISDYFSELASSFVNGLSAAEQGMRLDALNILPDDYLQKVDVGSMAFSLEAREPLLDHQLVEWAMKLPVSWKLRAGKNKYLLRKLAYRYIPQEILDRPKQGFSVPIDAWLRGPLKQWARDRIFDRSAYEGLPIDRNRVISLFELHESGARNVHPFLWAILMLLDYQVNRKGEYSV